MSTRPRETVLDPESASRNPTFRSPGSSRVVTRTQEAVLGSRAAWRNPDFLVLAPVGESMEQPLGATRHVRCPMWGDI